MGRGSVWREIVSLETSTPISRLTREREIISAEAIAFCRDFAGWLTSWERGFIAPLVPAPHRTLSDKQLKILVRLVEKCRVAEKATAV